MADPVAARRTTDLPAPLRRAQRRRALRAGVLGIGGLAVVAGLIATILGAQLLGSQAWRAGDPAAAGRNFAVNQRLNLVEWWIAPFNQGVARHGRGEWLDAAALYEEALALAPDAAHCRVVLNWSWALEAAGDRAAGDGHPEAAREHWAAAREVLSRADGCDDGSSGLRPDDAELPSASPSPTQSPPSTTPSVQPTAPGDDDAEAPADSDTSQPQPGSEQDQVNQTRQRIDQKTGTPTDPDSNSDGSDQPEADQSERLDERNQQAAEQRQRAQDERRPAEDAPVRSW